MQGRERGENVRTIDGGRLFAIVKGHHDLYKDATNPADKARRDECLQVMCDIIGAPTVYAIPVEWLTERHRKACEEADTEMMDAITRLVNEYYLAKRKEAQENG